MALDAQILLSILAHETSSGDISRTLRATPASYSLILGDGTGANQAQVVWSDARTIGAGGYEDLNFQALTDDRGTVALTTLKLIYLKNTSGAGSISLGTLFDVPYTRPANAFFHTPLSSDALGAGYQVRPGGLVVAADPGAAGYLVSASAKNFRVSGASGATYEIVLIGEGTVT